MSNGIKLKSAKGKVHGTKSIGNQAQATKNTFPEKSHRIGLIPPAMSHYRYEMVSTREARQILKARVLTEG